MRLAAAAVTVALAAGLAAGCGAQDPAREVRATLGAFGQASAHGDFHSICQRLLAPALVDQMEELGLPCEQAMRTGLQSVQRPSLSVGRVVVHRDHAEAVVLTAAANQPPSTDTLQLVHQAGSWRIASLIDRGAQLAAAAAAQPGY